MHTILVLNDDISSRFLFEVLWSSPGARQWTFKVVFSVSSIKTY